MRKTPGQSDYGSNFTISIGIVKNNADAAQHGRLQVYIPSIDSKFFKLEELPWATYVSPFGGTTVNIKVGRSQSLIPGITSYGFWAIPKIGAQVLCGFIEGDSQVRYWLGGVFIPQMNRTMPQSIDGGMTEIDQSGLYPQALIAFQNANLIKAGLQPGSIHYKTRGGYERSISYPSNNDSNKPTTNGYDTNPLQPELADSQTICLTSPGRHYFVMSDVDKYCRIRLKTTEGSQIIFDDTNERIYISTAQGKNWIELDEGNGKIYLYSDTKISIRSKNDINLYSDENINIVANKRVNIKSETRSVNLEALQDVRLLSTGADLMLTASRDIQLKTTNGPVAPAVPEKAVCSTGTVGWIYEWSEKGGSNTSSIRFDSATDVTASASKSINLSAKNALNLRSLSSDINIQSININFNASGVMNFTTPEPMGLVVIDGIEGQIPVFALNNAGSATTAEPAVATTTVKVTDHMILPDHEPWVRDADESKCKTPRNKSYQG